MFDRGGQEAGTSPARPLVVRLVPWAAIPIPVLLVAIVVLWFVDVDTSLESRSLLAVLNFTLVTSTSLVIGMLAGRTFIATGMPGTLFLGAGALLMGAAFLLAPTLGVGAPNVIATVHNSGMLAAGVLFVLGAWMSFRPRVPVRAPRPTLVAAYTVSLVLPAGTAYLALQGSTPPFFVEGIGGTPLRQVVVASSVATFALASLLLVLAQGNATTFRRWFAMGLALLAVGLLGVLLQRVLGSPINWVARVAQYLGSIYLLVASVTSAGEARRWGLPLEAELRAEREQASQLREAKEQLARVLEGSNDGFWEWNITTGEIDFSDRWAEMLGYKRAELAPSLSTWQGMVHPDDREEARTSQTRIVRGEIDRYDVDRRLRHKDGHWVWVHVRGKIAERDADGKPTRMSGTYTDISARMQAEEALRQSQQRLALILDNAREGINLLDLTTGKYVFMSPSQVALTGFSEHEIRHMTAEEAYGRCHPDDRHISVEQQASIAAGAEDLGTVEYRWRVKSGEYRWFSDARKVVRDQAGHPVAMVGISRDITDRKASEESLRRSEERFRTVLDGTSDGYWDRNFTTGHTFHSARLKEILGLPAVDSDDPFTFESRVHPEDAARLAPIYAGLPSSGDAHIDVEFRIRREDGSWRWVRSRGRILEWDGNGRAARMAGTITDIHAWKLIGDALRRATDELRRHVANTPLATVKWDASYRVTEFSGRAEEMFGWSAAEVLGKRIDEVPWVPEEDWPKVRAVMNEMDSRSRPNNVNRNRNRRKDGAIIHCEWYNSALYGPDGSLSSVFSLVQDVTEREKAREELAASERKLRAYFDSPEVGIAITNAGSDFLEVNDRFCSMMGLSRDEVLRGTWRDLTHPDDLAQDVVNVRRMLEGEVDTFSRDKRYVRRDGTILWAMLSVSCVRDDSGNVQFFVAILKDIGERVRAQEALKASEARFRTLAEGAPVGIFVTDPAGGIVYLNPVGQRLLGQTLDEAKGLGALAAIQPQDRDRVGNTWLEAVAAERSYRSEHRLAGRDGAVVSVSVHASPIRDASGHVTGYAGVMVDVTEQKELQRQVDVTSRLAALGTLVAGLAHEINNPLAAEMAGQGLALEVARAARQQLRTGAPVDVLANIRELDGVVEALEDAQEAGHRVAKIIRDMAAFARPDPVQSLVGLREVVDQGLRWATASYTGKTKVEVEAHPAPAVMGSASQLAQVVQNLVTNALKASRPGEAGAVTVRLGTDEAGRATVDVVDHGVGIAPENLTRVFEPFFTTRPTGEGRGTGLGLAVCHAIVTAHKGTLSVASEVGKGSTFTVRLPAAPVHV